MKKILLPLLALLLLAGGGAGAYFYMGKSEAATTADAAKEAKKAEGEAGKDESVYVQMAPIVLPIIDRNGISQTISMVVSLQVEGKAEADTVKEKLPRLADAFLSDMYGTLSTKAMMQSGVIKVSELKA
ncbi:MAG: flagellar basal body-associated FliL family protein, partial [Alphaproteobacteria bacterium]|nr:flagellar basal body-associated FliL family protein [Alphaproteobacteria bacterium]